MHTKGSPRLSNSHCMQDIVLKIRYIKMDDQKPLNFFNPIPFNRQKNKSGIELVTGRASGC